MKALELIDEFRSMGRKVTPQRLAIFKALEGNTSHPTAEDLYRMLVKQYPTMTLSTVYQTLKILRDDGEIRELSIERESRHYDPDTSPHHHTVCTRCGSVRDIRNIPEFDVPLPSENSEGFDFSEYQIAFYGTCERCRNEDTNRSRNHTL